MNSAGHSRVLLVDDDDRLAEMLADYLLPHGFHVERAANGSDGLARALNHAFDLVLLDVMLPGMDGMEVCRRLRAASDVPIIMLTARGEETDRVVGLELGADDYVPKPFGSRELVARMRAVLRRRHPPEHETPRPLRVGRLRIDPVSRMVTRDDTPCELTALQFDLLLYMAERPGRVLTREQLLEAVRGRELEPYDRSIDVHISRIRAAIEDDPRQPRFLRTVRGVGYQFSVAPNEEDQA